ncbi:MnhB domain-containing protein [Dyella sp.]|uniref:MnhB domain-containing protein n=3 Tax=Dyella sp. TaxID=1869338 RepID=UPI002D769EA8|nr:MnhB domain-containing protein [Dyella sp.]HET7330735.1 MnhB domain-containing protein [Dyella sp.]
MKYGLALRYALCILALIVLAPAAVLVALHMPAFGEQLPAYGTTVNAHVPYMRQATNVVTAIIFDVRGVDTLGEEFIFVAAITGLAVLLRGGRGEDASRKPIHVDGRWLPTRSEAVALLIRWMLPATVAFSIYVMAHGQLTPGGGFQAGAMLASALLLLFLGDGYRSWRQVTPPVVMQALEALGAAGCVCVGLLPLALGAGFLENVLPQGQSKSLTGGGLIPLFNVAVGMAITGGFANALVEFLEETREPEEEGQR